MNTQRVAGAHDAETAVQRLLAFGLQLHICKAATGAGCAGRAPRLVAGQLAAGDRAKLPEATRDHLLCRVLLQPADVEAHHASGWRPPPQVQCS